MIYSVTGTVAAFDRSMVAVNVGGVTFACLTTLTTAQKCAAVGSTVTLFTYLNVREDALELFGFYDKAELDCLKTLITVNGVGPKMAISILSELTADKIALSVAAGDYKALVKASGVGPKIAQRIVMELKDKLGAGLASSDDGSLNAVRAAVENTNTAEAVAALEMLGYSQTEAASAISREDGSLSVEELIKRALKTLSGRA